MNVTGASTDFPFTRLLRLIVEHNVNAVRELKQLKDTTKLLHEGGFWYYKTPDSSDSCECWYNLEYFDFVRGHSVDGEKLRYICESLNRGKCKHVFDKEERGENIEENRAFPITTLTHAAAAVGNEHVVKYLVEDVRNTYCSSKTGLKPIHLALIKEQKAVFNLLFPYNSNSMSIYEYNMYRKTYLGSVEFVNRDSATLTFSRRVCSNMSTAENISRFIKLYKISDFVALEVLIGMLPRMSKDESCKHILFDPILNGMADLARAVLTAVKNSCNVHEIALQDLILVSVLADENCLLQALIGENSDILCVRLGYNMLDVAKAFGSGKCQQILQPLMAPTPNIYKILSPYHFLVCMEHYIPCSVASLSLLSRCAKQGFDVNEVRSGYRYSVLQFAIEKGSSDFVKPLLELGADVDCGTGNKSLLMSCLDCEKPLRPRVCKRWSDILCKESLKELFYANRTPNLSRDDLYAAVGHDLHAGYLERVNSKHVLIKFVGINPDEVDIIANTFEDRFLGLSRFALLYELGFSFSRADSGEDYVDLQVYMEEKRNSLLYYGLRKQTKLEEACTLLRDYITKVRSHPRSLKSSCRLTIRRAYPGNNLLERLSSAVLPKTLVEYVVRPYILRPVDII